MYLRGILITVCAAAAFVVGFCLCGHVAVAAPPEFAPGQMWSIKSAPATTAKVVIVRVEPWQNRTVVHVSIIDIPVPKGARAENSITAVGHMPFDESALAESVDRLLGTGGSPAPGFEYAYEQWRADKTAGIFTISVSKAIELMLQSAGELSRER